MPEEILLNPESEEALSEALEREHIRPAYIFKGKELWPYSKRAELNFRQGRKCNLCPELFAAAFVFILLKRTEKTARDDMKKHVEPLTFNDNKLFESAVMDFAENLSDEDEAEAVRIYIETMDAVDKSRITAGAPDGQEPVVSIQKKTEPTPEASPIAAISSP